MDEGRTAADTDVERVPGTPPAVPESAAGGPAAGEPAVDGSAAGGPAAGDPASQPGRRRATGCLVELVQTVVLTAAIFLGIQAFVAQPFQVRMYSMQATFEPGDYVLVDKLSPRWDDYDRGDVVVFTPLPTWTSDPTPFIKRVIGVAGDTVEVRDDGFVWVNGARLEEPYLYRDETGEPEPTLASDGARWEIAQGELFVMGDHRMRSQDSRSFGPIPVSTVVGRGAVRYWPLSSFTFVSAPAYAGVPAP